MKLLSAAIAAVAPTFLAFAVLTDAFVTQCSLDKKSRRRRFHRLLSEATSAVLDEVDWQDYKEKCQDVAFDLSLYVDTHLLLFAVPDSATAGCPPLYFHSNVKTKEAVLITNLTEFDPFKIETIIPRTFPFWEIALAYDQMKVETGEFEIVLYNCGDFVTRFWAALGVTLSLDEMKSIAARLLEAENGSIVEKIRQSGNVSLLLGNGKNMSDVELVEELVASRARGVLIDVDGTVRMDAKPFGY